MTVGEAVFPIVAMTAGSGSDVAGPAFGAFE